MLYSLKNVQLFSLFRLILFSLVLRHINHHWLYNAKSSLYIYIQYILFGFVSFRLVLWCTNQSSLFIAKSIFIHVNSSISNNLVLHKYAV